jgi:hypothetical protein
MAGLSKICKLYGGLTVKDSNGKSVRYVWDYIDDKAVPESEMTKERWAASEKKKWTRLMKEDKKP